MHVMEEEFMLADGTIHIKWWKRFLWDIRPVSIFLKKEGRQNIKFGLRFCERYSGREQRNMGSPSSIII